MKNKLIQLAVICLLFFLFAGQALFSQDLTDSGEKAEKTNEFKKISPGLARIIALRKSSGLQKAALEVESLGIEVRKTLQKKQEMDFIPVILRLDGTLDRNRIVALGGMIDAVSSSYARVLVPISAIEKFDALEWVKAITLPLKPIAHGGIGPNASEAIGLTGADILHNQGYTGSGIKVAVVDLGFIGWAARRSEGELPANAVAVDFSGSGFESGTEHGVAVAEHVMDMAPGATLYGINIGDEVDLENAADYCDANGILIANHSVGWVNASYYDGTGPISSIINNSTANGTFWTVSSGNEAQRHWKSTWTDSDNDGILNWSGSDETNQLSGTYGTIQIFLNWNQYGNSVTDLDLYVYDRSGRLVAGSTGNQNGPQDPAEAVGITFRSSRAPYSVVVRRYSGSTSGLNLTLFSFYHNFEYTVSGYSISDPAAADTAYAVGAINQNQFGAGGPLESFSSYGPRNDGADKIQIAAPDGTTSRTYGQRGSLGTSFASPTTAGAAALLADKYGLTTPAAIRAMLDALAIDTGSPGYDYQYGAGLLHVE